jgi:hypothetical protein
VPLTVDEVVGYKKMDSIADVKRKEEAGDTLKNSKHKGFQPWDLLIGDNYKIGKHSNFRIDFPMPGFNTVEGFNLVYRVAFGTILQDTNKTRFTISPTFRYAFSREKLSGNLAFVFRNKNFRFELSGGRYIKQYNADEPILPVVNTLTTLFLEENLMKIYERDYVEIAGMNREERAEIAQILTNLRDGGLTMLLVEHDLRTVLNVSDHLFVMNFGRCVAEGKPRETALRPEVQEAYLGKRKGTNA